jgi:hypothetical protein
MSKRLSIFECLTSPVVLPKPNPITGEWKKHLKKIKKAKKKKKKKGKPFVRPKYKEYIKSQKWKQRRNEYYKTHPRECVICKSKHLVGLHHMTYKNLGRELDEDLVALCWG